jgi:Tol biopolymer transport system component
VYVHLLKGVVDTLWTADADGANARPFLKVRDRFFYLQTPRFAPNGCQVVFSGAGRTARGGSIGGHLAHLGVPSELYLAPCDGSSIVTIGETIDDVTPVWSADGTRIAFAIGGAISILTLATREVRRLAQTVAFTYGDALWLR